MVAPCTETICRTIASPCGTTADCPPVTGAVIFDPTPFAPPINVETEIDFTLDFEVAPTDADSASNRIVIGRTDTYLVRFNASIGAGPAGGTITTRILVDGVSNPELTFVHVVGAAPTVQSVEVFVALFAGNELTVTVEADFEGASVLAAALGVMTTCGPFTDVIVPQG